ncbi:phosphatidate cytidylyltransferase [Parapedomonas caeni]
MSGAASPSGSDLRVRVIAGIVLGVGALAILWAGGPLFALLMGLGGCAIVWEWTGITGAASRPWVRPAGLLVMVAAVVAGWFHLWGWAALATLLLATALALTGWDRERRHTMWLGLGLAYAVPPVLALLWLRDQADGLIIVLWLMLSVWATDSFAYFAGRAIGGPKLAPTISPKKTWAGLAGGMAGAALTGALVAAAFGLQPLALAPLSAAIAVVSQGGDLLESALKRAFDVKDSGHLIPGHGGIMDRVDGLVAVAPLVALGLVLGDVWQVLA